MNINMCRVKTKHIQLDPIKEPPLGKGQAATFKKVLFTVTNKIWKDPRYSGMTVKGAT